MKYKETKMKFDGITIEITNAGNLRIWGDNQLAGERVVTVKRYLIADFMKIIATTFKEAASNPSVTQD